MLPIKNGSISQAPSTGIQVCTRGNGEIRLHLQVFHFDALSWICTDSNCLNLISAQRQKEILPLNLQTLIQVLYYLISSGSLKKFFFIPCVSTNCLPEASSTYNVGPLAFITGSVVPAIAAAPHVSSLRNCLDVLIIHTISSVPSAATTASNTQDSSTAAVTLPCYIMQW